MSFDPTASKLVLFDQLPSVDKGAKVRFLACVRAYDSHAGRLSVVDRFTSQASATCKVKVDVHAILGSLSHELVEVGAIINIIGYIQRRKLVKHRSKRAKENPSSSIHRIEVNATVIWSAGAIQIDEYEAALLRLQQSAHGRARES